MATNMNAPLYVEGLCKNYPSFRLKEVSFALEKGKITGFIGRNGAGKTTTLNSVLSLVKPDAGTVLFSGLSDAEHSWEIREKIGFVSAGMTYYTRKKLRVITGITKTFYPAWDENAYRKHMADFGLDEEKTPAELSNGMKIKYALALALSHGADLLIRPGPEPRGGPADPGRAHQRPGPHQPGRAGGSVPEAAGHGEDGFLLHPYHLGPGEVRGPDPFPAAGRTEGGRGPE